MASVLPATDTGHIGRGAVGTLKRELTSATSPMVMASPGPVNTPSYTSTITSNFNGTPIAAGDTIWFNSVMKVSGVGSTATTITVTRGTITFAANGVDYDLRVPNSVITFSPDVSSATTTFDLVNNQWDTSVPLSFSQNVFLTGYVFPVSTALAGGINPVNWTATFYGSHTGVSINWQWAAAEDRIGRVPTAARQA